MCFPVPIMSEYKVGIKYILNEQREKRELLFSTFPSKKKKNRWSAPLAFTASWISLHTEGLFFVKCISLGCTQGLLRFSFLFHAVKAKSAGRLATHPQPTPNFMQFLFAFFWPANSVLSLHKNSTLWHLMNKITPWPGSTFGRGRTQKISSCPCTKISSVGNHSISVPISN